MEGITHWECLQCAETRCHCHHCYLQTLQERDEARQWAIRFRELLGYTPEEWHQHINRFKVDWDEYQAATDTDKWPDWLRDTEWER